MFSPITDFDSLVCLIRLKRGMLATAFSAVIGFRRSPATTAEAP